MTTDRDKPVSATMELFEALKAKLFQDQKELATLDQALAEVRAERDRLREAIRTHRAQKADDRCVEDDDRLYAALGDGVPCDRRVGDKAAMLANCARFIDRRCEAGGWPSYTDLQARVARQCAELAKLNRSLLAERMARQRLEVVLREIASTATQSTDSEFLAPALLRIESLARAALAEVAMKE